MTVVSYKCPNCNGGLIFDAKKQMFCCEYCLSDFNEDDLKKQFDEKEAQNAAAAERAANSEKVAEEQNSQSQQGAEDDDFANHTVYYSCPSCGAEVIADDTTAATFCFYCHNPVVLQGKLQGELRPDKIVPFSISKQQATEQFIKWVTKKRFLRADFFSKQQIEKISGVYFPYWMSDYELEGVLEGTGRNLRVWRVGNTEHTETSVYRVTRGGKLSVRNMLNCAINHNDKDMLEGVQPYNQADLVDFSMPYLSGFQAEKKNIERDAIESNVRNDAKQYATDLLQSTVTGYSSFSPSNSQSNITQSSWKYCLLPVWFLTYQDKKKNKTYYYAMNGKTGKVCGDLPVSGKKLALLASVLSTATLLLSLLGGYLL